MNNKKNESRESKLKTFSGELVVLLYRYDLVGINFGSNPDEYAPETRAIFSRLHTKSSVAQISQMTHEIFVNYFSILCIPEKEDDIYTELATEIWELWQSYMEKGLEGPRIQDFVD